MACVIRELDEWKRNEDKCLCYSYSGIIRAVFNYAIDEEITTLYPFRKFKIKKEETRKRSLTIEQIRVLKAYP